MAGFSQNSLPMSDERFEVMTENNPAGTPARSASTASAMADRGVSAAGRETMPQPAASAGATLRAIMAFGKFHGVIEAATPMGCLMHGDALVALMAGDGFAVDALGLFAEPLDIAGAIGTFALGLGQRLALFGGQDGAQIVMVFHAQVEPLAQHGGAFLAGAGGPFVAHLIGLGDGAGGIGAGQVRHMGDDVAARGVGDGEGRAVRRVDPFAGDIGLVRHKCGVFQKGTQVGDGIKQGSLRDKTVDHAMQEGQTKVQFCGA